MNIDNKELKINQIQIKTLDKMGELIVEVEWDNEDSDKLTELRRVFLMTLKGIYSDLNELGQCSPDTLIILTQSADIDLVNYQDLMNSWQFLVSQFNQSHIDSLFFQMMDECIESRNSLSTYIFYIYDVVSSYIESMEILKEAAKSFNFSETLIHEMIAEVEANLKSAVLYIDDYLQVSFPEISRELQTKKASLQVLGYEISVLKSNLQSGQLEEKDFMLMKKNIDSKVVILNNMNPSWELPGLFDQLCSHPLLGTLPEMAIRELISECRQKTFCRDQIIFQEGEPVNEAFIIQRGGGSEYSDHYKIREKRILGDVSPIYMLVLPSIRYHTSFVTDCVNCVSLFKVSALQKMMKQHPQFEEEVWRYSLPLLSKIFNDQLKPLCFFTKSQIKEVAHNSTFVRIKKNKLIKIDQGAILLKGGLIEAKDNIPELLEEQDEDDQVDKQPDENKAGSNDADGWKREAIVLIGPHTMPLRSISNSLLLVFDSWSQLQIN